jgi:probable HAF family extracellular repeat protein
MGQSSTFATLALAAALAAPSGAQAAPLFSITVLPAEMTPGAMNQAGHVVGSGIDGIRLWRGGAAIRVPAVGLGYSDGLGINKYDDLAGTSAIGTGGVAFAWIGRTVHNIGAAAPDFASSFARRINDSGWVVGALYDGVGGIESRGFIYRNGDIRLLPTLGGNNGSAFGVSNRGHVTGRAGLASTPPNTGEGHAYLFHNGKIKDLGALPGDDISVGLDVNDLGQVVGSSASRLAQGNRGFLYSRGRMVNVGTLGGNTTDAFGINNHGVVVGRSFVPNEETAERGFIYAKGRIVDLNRLVVPKDGWVIKHAEDINDSFQVLAYACRNGIQDCRTVRLDPLIHLCNAQLPVAMPKLIHEAASNR